MTLKGFQLLIIENVGNLVCSANYDLGEHIKVVLASTTKGDDRPLKYPAMFRNASILLVNKIDLLPYVNCNITDLKNNALRINPALNIFETSCTTNQGIEMWCDWLEKQVKSDSHQVRNSEEYESKNIRINEVIETNLLFNRT